MLKSTEAQQGYLTHIPVRSYLEADILSKESTWAILSYVKMAGARGAAADEISRTLKLPPSLVYATLKELRRLEFVSILPREKKRSWERKRRYLCERTTWGKYRVDSFFMNILTYEGVVKRLTKELQAPLLKIFSDLFEEFRTKSRLRPYLPTATVDEICPICGRNHQATEFVYAVLLAALDPFITESPEFTSLLRSNGYCR